MPRDDYYARQEARKERLESAAERAASKAASAFKRADLREEVSGIPFGQPVLVGHYSEGRHRAAIRRADNAMRQGIEQSKRAGDLASRAANIGNNGISSDAPDAVDLLREKLAKLEARQEMMQQANKLVRKKDVAGLVAMGFTQANAEQAVTVPVWGNKFCAFEPYQLSNNSATIRQTKARIAQLEREATRETKTVETNIGVTMVENAEANRVQLIFPGKPAPEIIAELKARGFRWSPTEGAWQRMLNNAGIWAGKCVLDKITPKEGEEDQANVD